MQQWRPKDLYLPPKQTNYDDNTNWTTGDTSGRMPQKEIKIKRVEKRNEVQVKIGNKETDMFADSGADVSVIPSDMYRKGMGVLVSTDAVLAPYGTKEGLPVKSKFRTTITTKRGAKVNTWVYVVDSKYNVQPLLGDDDATTLGFLIFQPEG